MHRTKITVVEAAVVFLATCCAWSQTFVSTGPIITARYRHSATLLPNGQVVVAGGFDTTNGLVSTIEVYNPTLGVWLQHGILRIPRVGHVATLLPDGKILISGGWGRNNFAFDTEVFDPVLGASILAGRLHVGREDATATLLSNGKVLLVGGYGINGPVRLTELYEPATRTWSDAGQLAIGRYRHTATSLSDGRVLVAGGKTLDASTDTAEIYNPSSGLWAFAGNLLTPRSEHSAALLRDGKVLIAGGLVTNTLGGFVGTRTSELFNPALATSQTNNPMNYPLIGAAIPLLDGNVLVAGQGGYGDVYHAGSQVWTSAGTMIVARSFDAPSATLLADGQVLFAGGLTITNQALVAVTDAELYTSKPLVKPSITVQPMSETARAGADVVFAVLAMGAQPLTFQWQRNGVDIPGATTATLTLGSVTAAHSDCYSVVVWNSFGSVVSQWACLAVLTDGANGTRPTPISTPSVPPKEVGKDGLVVITHGWQPLQPEADLAWMAVMSNAIQSRVSPNWTITNFLWLDQATFPYPELVLYRAQTTGRLYGQQLASQGWTRIHFIGHSAGAALIENAAAEIPSGVTVHCTFLDPYVGLLFELQSAYGEHSDWADCYFTQDLTAGWTAGRLPHAYNVDVDWLDPNHEVFSLQSFLVAFSTKLSSKSHQYSHDFYTQTVTNTNPGWCAANFGFTFSTEGGGQARWGSHSVGNEVPFVLCGPANAIASPTLPIVIAAITIDQVSHAVSDAITATVNAGGFVLHSISSVLPFAKREDIFSAVLEISTNTPAWLAVEVTVTNAVNFVQCDAAFIETNAAQGLLTAYWNTNEIGMLDERTIRSGLQTYRFRLPDGLANGLYTLSFRLDAFNGASSHIIITNISTGFMGITQRTKLGLSLTNGIPLVTLTAASNFLYLIQSSTNLSDWKSAALLSSTNGSAYFTDLAVTNSKTTFYRALAPSP